MILASFAEVMSIGAVLPFLGVLTAPEKIFNQELAQSTIEFLNIKTPKDLLLPFTLIFIVSTSFAGMIRVTLLWAQTRLSVAIGSDFSVEVYERTLYQPYSLHISRNSSEVLAGAQKAKDLVGFIIQPMLLIIGASFILSAVIITLIIIQPLIALSSIVGFGFIYIFVVTVTKYRIAKNSQIIAFQQIQVTKAIQEGLGGIRDVLIDGSQPVYSKMYRDAFIPMQIATASNQVVAGMPRFGVEALGMILIAVLAYFFATASSPTSGVTDFIPILGALALGAQRLLPVLQQIYTAFISIKAGQVSTQDALDLLNQPMPNFSKEKIESQISFQSNITLKDVSYRYSNQGPWILRDLNLDISKGSCIGFIGVTGSGKSTLIDIILGLLSPTEGTLLIDELGLTLENTQSWQRQISHVPQSIFLADISIAENIALGVPFNQIDLKRVKQVAEQAQISKIIENLPNGYDTQVGERGVRLSGGQRQRIGIARALYKQASVIIFDEATSALDNETEAEVINAIQSLASNKTILIIAHRLTTLKHCDLIVELTDGNIRSISSYDLMMRGKNQVISGNENHN